MNDIIITSQGRAGLITLNRPEALNALTWDMCLAIEAALDGWRADVSIQLIIIDGAGDRAFCAGGDIADMYKSGRTRDYEYGRKFWRDEYRLNAKIAKYPKPIITFMHGFTMGGGVGVGCHASDRIVCENTQIAMPECTIGLVPDVGGSLLLARAPGYVGTYLGLTGDRMDGSDAIFTGFADHFVPRDQWPELRVELMATGEVNIATTPPTTPRLANWQSQIDESFRHDNLDAIVASLDDGPAGQRAFKLIHQNSPLAMACAINLIDAARQSGDIDNALRREYRFTHRAVADSDFIEGIRAAIIDRDRKPVWKHLQIGDLCAQDIAHMTASLGALELKL